MATIEYVEQHSSQIAFTLIPHPAPRDQVRVLSERTISIAGLKLTLAIIGSSHFLEMAMGCTSLCELLACPLPAMEGIPTLARMSGPSNWSYGTSKGDISYQFQLQKRTCSPEEFQRESARLSAEGWDKLVYRFPGDAITALEWTTEGQQAMVSTYHTFPNESTIVQTRSLIAVGGPGGSQ